ncbi:MAG: lipid II:glycine glycyltransferase FemX [Anaerolineae bacterium]
MSAHNQAVLLDPCEPRWMSFICSCPEANVFHHPNWLMLMQECYGYSPAILAIEDRDGTIRAGIPFMDVRSPLTGRRRVSLPFSDYCSPLASDQPALEALTDEIVSRFEFKEMPKTEVRWCLPARPEIQQVSEFVLHTIPLSPNEEEVSRRFKRTHLQNIRTAQERGVTVEFGSGLEHLKAFYELQLETRKRHGVPAQPWMYFELLWKHIVKPGMGFVLLAHKDQETVAGMVYLGWGRTLIAKYAASREDRFNLRPNNLLFWEGIRWGCQHGFAVFDMGRTETSNAGLRNFKSRWGAKEEPLFYSILSRRVVGSSNGRIEQIMHAVIERSPLWVCRLSGELLYRHVG